MTARRARSKAADGSNPWPAAAERRLFVYGTLAPGEVNAHMLAGLPGTWEPASVRGRLYAEGWGAALGFPALVLDASAGVVQGQLFSSEQLPAHWQRLDRFEGEAYRRVPVSVTVASGEQRPAQVYELNPAASA